MDRKVSTAYLQIGMYISKLDRPWKQTPFLLQGFMIKHEDEISDLVKYCDYVYIDNRLGITADMYLDTVSKTQAQQRLSTNKQAESIINTGKKNVEYIDKSTTVDELPIAREAFNEASVCIARIVENGQLNMTNIKGAVEPIIESMIRNSDAFIWLLKMQQHDASSYDHSVQNCALGIAFGRHLGLNKRALSTLATGLLLMDIGKTKLPKELLLKSTAQTDDEKSVVKKHVAFTVEMLRKTKGITEHITNIALTHHERYDGSGYPNGLTGVQTPAYGRMAAIIDCYDEMITDTPNEAALTEHKALQKIYNLRDKAFQRELVEQFMQCMGVYPTGSLVELSSGEVGAILSQNSVEKLKPKVISLLDKNKKPYRKCKVYDLAKQKRKPLHIAKSLDNNAYDVDVKKIRF